MRTMEALRAASAVSLCLVMMAGCADSSAEAQHDAAAPGDSGSTADATVAGNKDAASTDGDGADASGAFRPALELFDAEGIHQVEITVPAADWQAILADAKDVSRERVFHKGSVRFDGTEYGDVGLRNFGDGSQQANPSKPNVRLKFNAFDPTLKGPEKQRNIRLKASGEDPSYLHEPLFYTMLLALDVACPRFSFARVRINGENYGLYIVLEQVDKQMMKRLFGGTTGQRYEAELSCVGLNCPAKGCAAVVDSVQPKRDASAGEVVDNAPLVDLVTAIDTSSDAEFEAKVGALVDWPNLLGVYAAELVAGDVDGLVKAGANFELLQDPESGLLHVVRGGADVTFHFHLTPPELETTALTPCKAFVDKAFQRIWANATLRAKLLARIRELQCGAFSKDAVKAFYTRYATPLKIEAATEPKVPNAAGRVAAGVDDLVSYLYARHTALDALLGPCP